MKRSVVAGVLALILLLPILFMGALIAIAGEDIAPSEKALAEIPADLLSIYQAAARTCDGLDWTVLAAIHKIETNFGRSEISSSKGALGPMQFMPSTWRSYASDGDGDGLADINNVSDAIFSAALLLCENGAGDPARLADAIWTYNHSDSYVAEVLSLAASYGVIEFDGAVASATTSDILSSQRISLTSNARADLEAGVVDSRLLSVLSALSRHHTIGISVFKTGHSKYTKSGSISLHYFGRAADISFLDGLPVSRFSASARQLVLEISGLPESIRPDEIGHPFADLRVPGGFTDGDHQDHVHLGYEAVGGE